jgi:sugar phosphate isomerase/epimerase
MPAGRNTAIPCLKGSLPFKLATTSFVYPAGWADNAARLAGLVDEIELVLFESGAASLPDAGEIAALRRVAAAGDLTYNVHLPLDLDLGSRDPAQQDRAVDAIDRIVALTAALEPSTFTLHLNCDLTSPDARQLDAWQASTAAGVRALLDRGHPAAIFSVETLMYPFAWAEPILAELGLHVCIDVGHLALRGEDPLAALDRHWERTDVLHLYGPQPPDRHMSLAHLPQSLLDALLARLDARRFRGIVSLEVFRHADLVASLPVLARAWRRISKDKSKNGEMEK